jgi:transposase-like protein
VSERRRRSWARDEKRRIVEESLQEGAPIAEALDVMSSTPIDGTSGENSFIVFALA